VTTNNIISMQSRWNIAGKVVVGAMLTMLPYQAWVMWHASQHTLPHGPWVGIIGLTCIIGNVVIWIRVRTWMFTNALTGITYDAVPHVSSAGTRVQNIHFSSVGYLAAFSSIPWYSLMLGLLPKGFPRTRGAFGIPFAISYFAVGSLVITPEQLTVSAAMVGDNFGAFCTDESKAFSFSFVPSQIRSVQRFDSRQIAKSLLPFPYFRIQTTVSGAEDFLVGSGAFEFYDIRQETSDIWAALGMFLRNRPLAPKGEVHERRANVGNSTSPAP
jgi:hypothetical protein